MPPSSLSVSSLPNHRALQNNVLLTGGEDSKVCLWSCPALSADAALPGARDAAASPTGSGFGGRGVLREDSVDVDGGADAAMEVGDDQQGADGAMDVDSPPRQRARKRELDPGMGRRIVEERVCGAFCAEAVIGVAG